MDFYRNKFKKLKKEKKITSIKLAGYLGVSRRTIWSWETGKAMPKKGDIQLMAQLLEIDINAISDIAELEDNTHMNFEHYIFKKHMADLDDWINELKKIPNANINSLIDLYNKSKELNAENLRLKNKLFRSENILDTLEPIVYSKDINLTYKYVNNAFLYFVSRAITKEDIIGKTAINLFPRREVQEIINSEREVIDTGQKILNKKIVIPNTNGNQIGLLTIFPHFNYGHKLVEIVCTIKDITEISKVLTRQEELETSINSLRDTVYIMPENRSKYLFISDGVTKITGWNADEFINNSNLWYDLVHPEDVEKVQNRYNKKKELFDHAINYRILHKDGTVRWVHDEMSERRNKQDNVILFGIVRDITETHLLQARRLQLEKAINETQELVWVGETRNKKFYYNYISDNIEQVHGVSKNEIINSHGAWKNSVYSLDKSKFKKWLKESKFPKKLDYRIVNKDKDIRWVSTKIERRRNILFGVCRDVSERKIAESERIELEEAINCSESLVIVAKYKDTRDKNSFYYSYIGDKIYNYFGLTKKELSNNIGKWQDKIINPKLKKKVIQSHEKTKYPIYNEYSVKDKNNNLIWLSHKTIKVGSAFYSYINDITADHEERSKMEAIISVLNVQDDAIWVTKAEKNKKAKSLYINKAKGILYQKNIQEIMKDVDFWKKYIHPDDFESLTLKDKSNRYASLNYRLKLSNGTVKYIEEQKNAYIDKNGTVYSGGIQRDVTERKIENEKNTAVVKLLENSNDAFWVAKVNDDLYYDYIYNNPARSKLYEVTKAEMLQNPYFWKSITHPDDIKKVESIITDMDKKQKSKDFHFRLKFKDGRIKHIEETRFVKLINGTLYCGGSQRDITNRVLNQEKNKLILNSLNSSPDSIRIKKRYDSENIDYIFINKATYEIYETNDFAIKTWWTSIDSTDQKKILSELKNFYNSKKKNINMKYRLNINNKIKYIYSHIYKTEIDGVVYEVAIERDISRR
ncbi:MAG: PAS domain-containing protein [bacterium]|nr:PAS domain-containing protein [bacterium]